MVKGKLKQRGYKRDVLQSYKMRVKVIKNRMERYNLIVLNNMTINFRTNQLNYIGLIKIIAKIEENKH